MKKIERSFNETKKKYYISKQSSTIYFIFIYQQLFKKKLWWLHSQSSWCGCFCLLFM